MSLESAAEEVVEQSTWTEDRRARASEGRGSSEKLYRAESLP